MLTFYNNQEHGIFMVSSFDNWLSMPFIIVSGAWSVGIGCWNFCILFRLGGVHLMGGFSHFVVRALLEFLNCKCFHLLLKYCVIHFFIIICCLIACMLLWQGIPGLTCFLIIFMSFIFLLDVSLKLLFRCWYIVAMGNLTKIILMKIEESQFPIFS